MVDDIVVVVVAVVVIIVALDGDDEICGFVDFFALSTFCDGLLGKNGFGILLSNCPATRADVDLSVSVLLSVDDVSGVMGVRGCGGLLLGEGLLRFVPWSAHFASNFDLAFEPGGLPTIAIRETNIRKNCIWILFFRYTITVEDMKWKKKQCYVGKSFTNSGMLS